MADLNLKAQIEGLLKLQTVDSEAYALNQAKLLKPEQLKALEAVFEAKKQGLSAAEKNLLDIQKLKKDKEIELGAQEESIKKFQGQLFSLKTNKEYQSMLGQIDGVKADKSVIEEKILNLFDEIDLAKAAIEKEKQLIAVEEKAFNEQKKQVNDALKEIDDRLAQLHAQRQQVLPEVDPKILIQYERILSGREGRAIVAVKNYCCQGCHMSVTPQTVNLVKMYATLVTCEVCNRILYIADESN